MMDTGNDDYMDVSLFIFDSTGRFWMLMILVKMMKWMFLFLTDPRE